MKIVMKQNPNKKSSKGTFDYEISEAMKSSLKVAEEANNNSL